MTNPDNIVRVRARNGGRASVYEANGWAQAYTSGLLEGTGVIQNTVADMNVLVGGSSAKPDVVLAENAAGYRIALDIVGQQAVAITAPASNSRISAIVAYTDDLSLATTEDTVTGSPSSCGLIVVNGTASVNPTEPTDNQIRTAITADGATGSQAAYCVIATILVANDTTAITNTLITTNAAKLAGTGVVSSSNIDFTTLSGNYSTTEIDTGYTWVDGGHIYKKTIVLSGGTSDTQNHTNHGISNFGELVKAEGVMKPSSGSWIGSSFPQQYSSLMWSDAHTCFRVDSTKVEWFYSSGVSVGTIYLTLYYTKTS